jgi:hypothetical protein
MNAMNTNAGDPWERIGWNLLALLAVTTIFIYFWITLDFWITLEKAVHFIKKSIHSVVGFAMR